MPKNNLTDRWIRGVKTDLTQEDFWDILTPGFGIRVTMYGKKSFFCRYRVGRRQRRMRLGDFPALKLAEARVKFRDVQKQRDKQIDPQVLKQQARVAETVEELFQAFFLDREGKISAGTLTRYKSIYRHRFKRPLGSLRAKDIRKAHVIPLFRALAERTPTQCERAEQLLQACFNHATRLDLLEYNPLHKLPRFGKTRIGERFLSTDEVAKYLRAIDQLPIMERTYFFLLLFYGTRPGELLKWRWEWIQKRRVVIPREFQKNGRTLVLPLTTHAFKLLRELRSHTSESGWLFPGPIRTSARYSFQKKLMWLRKQVQGELWNLRDVRRTTETLLRELGTLSEIVSVILNHNTSHLRKIYDKSENLPDKRRALVRYGRYLKRLKCDKKLDLQQEHSPSLHQTEEVISEPNVFF